VFSAPLSLFLLGIAVILAYSGYHRFRTPGIAEAVRLLADGDLDQAERLPALRAVVNQAAHSSRSVDRWAGLLAAVSLGDREAYTGLAEALGGTGVVGNLPPAEERVFLHLGDPMLGNFLTACAAEAAGDRAGAIEAWGHVRVECQLSRSPLAAELADAALLRLR
jgi:hypothetical protein